MNISVISENELSGDFGADIKAGRLRAFDSDGTYIEPSKALVQLDAKRNTLDGVSAASGTVAAAVWDSFKRAFSVPTLDAKPESKSRLSAYDAHKQRLANAWQEPGSEAQRVTNQ
jgi:hypothetical protein